MHKAESINHTGPCPRCNEAIPGYILKCTQCGELFCAAKCMINNLDPDSDGNTTKCPKCKETLTLPENSTILRAKFITKN